MATTVDNHQVAVVLSIKLSIKYLYQQEADFRLRSRNLINGIVLLSTMAKGARLIYRIFLLNDRSLTLC